MTVGELFDVLERDRRLAEIEEWDCALLAKLLRERRMPVTPLEAEPVVGQPTHWAWGRAS